MLWKELTPPGVVIAAWCLTAERIDGADANDNLLQIEIFKHSSHLDVTS